MGNLLHNHRAICFGIDRWIGIQLVSSSIWCVWRQMIKYITNRYESVVLPWEPGLIEWLQEHYPHSKYRIVEIVQTGENNEQI